MGLEKLVHSKTARTGTSSSDWQSGQTDTVDRIRGYLDGLQSSISMA